MDTARAMFTDIIHSLVPRPRRFYILNTGILYVFACSPKPLPTFEGGHRSALHRSHERRSRRKKVRQSGGTHADEIETSMMLYIAPETVRMKKGARDLHPNQPGGLTRDPQGKGTYSPTGAWGDPTLATREKGQAARLNPGLHHPERHRRPAPFTLLSAK